MTRPAIIAWLATLAEFAGVCLIVTSIALLCVGFAPEVGR